MNYIWGGMLIIGIVYGIVTGNIQTLTDTIINSSKEAVSLSLNMLGIIAFWTGLMQIGIECGMIDGLHKILSPLLRLLFPRIKKDSPAMKSISLNFAANILGLGWAATPAGLQAIKDLKKYHHNKDLNTASDEMCTFLVMNISSLQLIPVNVIAYRSQYGSVNPARIIIPGIIATLASTVTAIVICLFMCRNNRLRTKQMM